MKYLNAAEVLPEELIREIGPRFNKYKKFVKFVRAAVIRGYRPIKEIVC